MERLYVNKTILDERSIEEHFSRYRFSMNYIQHGFAVLDAACGSGYGTAFLADAGATVTGVEISDHALDWAKKMYGTHARFVQANLNEKLPFEDAVFDTVVSFETLEHVAGQEIMLSEFSRVLKRGGTLLISSPDREVITERAGADNKFHINELSKKEFIALLRKHFTLTALYGQTKYSPLPWYKMLIKKIVKLDGFKIRRHVVRLLGLKLFVHKMFSPIAYSPIERVSESEPNDYYVLLAVCKKKE